MKVNLEYFYIINYEWKKQMEISEEIFQLGNSQPSSIFPKYSLKKEIESWNWSIGMTVKSRCSVTFYVPSAHNLWIYKKLKKNLFLYVFEGQKKIILRNYKPRKEKEVYVKYK